ncbi:MAG: hypothetical protein ACO1QB_14530 [Verrucomicrobiales bacterium]
MNKLSKEKRDKLILTIIGILGVIGLLYTFVLSNQQDNLDTYLRRTESLKDKYYKNKKLADRGPRILEELTETKTLLDAQEATMVPQGNYYIWFFKLVDEFRRKQGLGAQFIADMTQPEFSEVGLLPRFPYKAAIFGVRLSGHFHEIGKFIADFENAYPHMRIQNVRIQPEVSFRQTGQFSTSSAPQKLNVELKIVTLIRPGIS